jgi:exodeoxyribonuclease V gamma subunit
MLNVVQSNRMERLAEALAEVLGQPLKQPLAPEWISIQSQGMKTWLAMQLASHLGVWGNAKYLFPKNLMAELSNKVLAVQMPDLEAFGPERLAWSVFASLPNHLHLPEFEALRIYIDNNESSQLKRFQLACHIARIFERYCVYRPEMILQWEARPNGPWTMGREKLPETWRWQPMLWNALVKTIGSHHPANAARSLIKKCQKQVRIDLPERISVFGISTLPPLYLQILDKLPATTQVTVYLLSPSSEYWAHTRSKPEIHRSFIQQQISSEDLGNVLHLEEGNPLLASLGRLGRDFQLILGDLADDYGSAEDLYQEPTRTKSSLLHQIQSEILHLNKPQAHSPDASISFHACHSPLREVEILYDQIREMLEADHRLTPKDIIVMAPDIEEYAPLIEAVFDDENEPSSIPYAISDRIFLREAPVVNAFMELLETINGRVSIVQVFNLLAHPPIHRRLGLSPDDVTRVQDYAVNAGVRWGLDAEHRKSMGLAEFSENTWRFGLDRLLLGIAMPNQNRLFGQCLPCDLAEGQQANAIGLLAHFCHLIFEFSKEMRHPLTPQHWESTLLRLLDALLEESLDNAPQHQTIRNAIVSLVDRTKQCAIKETLDLDVVTSYLSDSFCQQQSSAGFLAGGVTFCSLLPMRSIPHPMVCLLGMNDNAYPRSKAALGFDLMARFPRIGDRSIRLDDRYLFLETLLSARKRFLISFVGQRIQDNRPIPPSVVVSELLDIIKEKTDPKDNANHALILRHPLKPFSPRYFGLDKDERLFSYNSTNLESARALFAKKQKAPVLMPEKKTTHETRDLPLADAQDESQKHCIQMDELILFFKSPAKQLLRSKLQVRFGHTRSQPAEQETMELDPLLSHQIGSLILAGRLRGQSPSELSQLIQARGILPPRNPGRVYFEEAWSCVDELFAWGQKYRQGAPLEPLSFCLSLEPYPLVGRLNELGPTTRVHITYDKLHAKRLLDGWIKHLVLNSLPGNQHPKGSVLIGRSLKDNHPSVIELPPVAKAALFLGKLIDIFVLGKEMPLRFFPETSLAYTETYTKNIHKNSHDEESARQKARAAARQKFYANWKTHAEADDPGVHRLFRHMDPLVGGPNDARLDFHNLALTVFSKLIEIRKTQA